MLFIYVFMVKGVLVRSSQLRFETIFCIFTSLSQKGKERFIDEEHSEFLHYCPY